MSENLNKYWYLFFSVLYQIEEPGGEQQVVHVEHTEEQVVEVPTEEEQAYVEYESIEEGSKPQEYVIAAAPGGKI